jgi:hydroxypyruvate isomerase
MLGHTSNKQSKSLRRAKVKPENQYTKLGLPYDFGVTEKMIEKHLRPFWLKYNQLSQQDWFNKLDINLKENKDKLPQVIVDYARELIKLVEATNRNNLQLKYDYYQALSKLIQYLGGELGK